MYTYILPGAEAQRPFPVSGARINQFANLVGLPVEVDPSEHCIAIEGKPRPGQIGTGVVGFALGERFPLAMYDTARIDHDQNPLAERIEALAGDIATSHAA